MSSEQNGHSAHKTPNEVFTLEEIAKEGMVFFDNINIPDQTIFEKWGVTQTSFLEYLYDIERPSSIYIGILEDIRIMEENFRELLLKKNSKTVPGVIEEYKKYCEKINDCIGFHSNPKKGHKRFLGKRESDAFSQLKNLAELTYKNSLLMKKKSTSFAQDETNHYYSFVNQCAIEINKREKPNQISIGKNGDKISKTDISLVSEAIYYAANEKRTDQETNQICKIISNDRHIKQLISSISSNFGYDYHIQVYFYNPALKNFSLLNPKDYKHHATLFNENRKPREEKAELAFAR